MDLKIDIRDSSFSEVLEYWQSYLWPNRQSPIESISAIDRFGNIDMAIMSSRATFIKATYGDDIIGVGSGFSTGEGYYRLRGLWVQERHRRAGLGERLARTIFEQALRENCRNIWTMSRESAKSFYLKIGFQEYKRTDAYEGGPHFLVQKKLD